MTPGFLGRLPNSGKGMMTSSELGLLPRNVLALAPAVTSDGTPTPGAVLRVYGVRSTRIYCRPGCPARKARPDQIVWFVSPSEAEATGYRACRRCRPDEGEPRSRAIAAVEQVCRRLAAPSGSEPDLPALAREVGYSPSHFQRIFTQRMGVSPRKYREAMRTRRFREELRLGRSVRGATYAAGRRSLSWPSEGAAGRLGMDAGTYRRGAPEVPIEFVVAPSRLGPLLVATTSRGICSVAFGATPAALAGQLAAEFPRASVAPSRSPRLRSWVRRIVASAEGGGRSLGELPLDIRATAFQARVWEAVRAIPRGHTRSYSEIAATVGSPSSARAVARAVGANPTALLIPCQRVVRRDGALGGYRWGVDRKARLLRAERLGRARAHRSE